MIRKIIIFVAIHTISAQNETEPKSNLTNPTANKIEVIPIKTVNTETNVTIVQALNYTQVLNTKDVKNTTSSIVNATSDISIHKLNNVNGTESNNDADLKMNPNNETDPKFLLDSDTPFEFNVSCTDVECPSTAEPVCVKLRYTVNGKKKTVYIVMINRCEMQYVNCYQGVEAVEIPMHHCEINVDKNWTDTENKTKILRNDNIDGGSISVSQSKEDWEKGEAKEETEKPKKKEKPEEDDLPQKDDEKEDEKEDEKGGSDESKSGLDPKVHVTRYLRKREAGQDTSPRTFNRRKVMPDIFRPAARRHTGDKRRFGKFSQLEYLSDLLSGGRVNRPTNLSVN